jgi:hypothetical protein
MVKRKEKIMSVIKCEVSNIEWVYDDDGDVGEMPDVVNMTICHDCAVTSRDEAIDFISEELSNIYGVLHNGFSVDELEITEED